MGYTDRREVKQFQFTAWPDHGVPEHPAPFLQFLKRVVNMNPVDAGPCVTHCRLVFMNIAISGIKDVTGMISQLIFGLFS